MPGTLDRIGGGTGARGRWLGDEDEAAAFVALHRIKRIRFGPKVTLPRRQLMMLAVPGMELPLSLIILNNWILVARLQYCRQRGRRFVGKFCPWRSLYEYVEGAAR